MSPRRTEKLTGCFCSYCNCVICIVYFNELRWPQLLYASFLGLAFHFLSKDATCQPGIKFCSKILLRTGVALLGGTYHGGANRVSRGGATSHCDWCIRYEAPSIVDVSEIHHLLDGDGTVKKLGVLTEQAGWEIPSEPELDNASEGKQARTLTSVFWQLLRYF